MPASHHVLESIHVTGGTHFPDVHLDFVDALNCLIGGRGAGKSGILNLLVFALGAPVAPERARDQDDYVRATLGAGTVTVTVRTQHGARYTSSRSYGELPVVRGADGERTPVTLDGELFQIDAYGQNEIEEIARSPRAQLALIDKFAEQDMRRIGEMITQNGRHLALNAAEVKRLDGEIADETAREEELPGVAEALRALQVDAGGKDAPEVARAHEAKVERGRERTAMSALTHEVAAARAGLDAFAASAARKLGGSVEAGLETGAHPEVFRRAHEAAHRAAVAIEARAGQLRAELASVAEALASDARVLVAAHDREDDAWQALVVRADADRERAAARERLHRRYEELAAVARRAGERRREHADKRAQVAKLMLERERLHHEAFETRERVTRALNEALGDGVRVTVREKCDREAYEALLAELLHGTGVRAAVIKDIARSVAPDDLARSVEKDDLSPLVAADNSATGKPERARKILAALRSTGRLFELETVTLGDVPLIELKVGSEYRLSTRVSIGQRCTCILPILLLQSAAPLLIDQAEDNLDNAFIYDVLVKIIARTKGDRQLVIVTHNANIPVLGDAERVFVLTADDGKGEVAAFGTVDQVRGWAERLLEGGREAFQKRGARYGAE